MRGVFRNVRPDERGLVTRAFAVLATLLFSHTVLETGRDALFLTRASSDRLPIVYIATAVVALWLTRRSGVLGTLAALRSGAFRAAAGALVLAALLSVGLDAAVYLLYVGSGLVTSTLLVHLFALLGSALSITQAKRVFPVIGLGSILGALAGSAAASELSRHLPPVALMGVAAVGFGAVGWMSGWLSTRGAAEHKAAETGWLDRIRTLMGAPYSRRVSAIVLASSATLTVADYLFKAVVEANVKPEDLGTFFGRAYFLLNALSLLSQAGLVAWILKRFDLIVGLSILPFLLLCSTGLAWVVGGAAAAVLIKAPEGVLKHSLHRTTMELLYVPLDAETRARIKSLLDLLGLRLGQAGASAAILVVASVWEPAVWGLLVLLAGLWIGACLNLRVHYLDLFHRRLRRGWGAFVRPQLTLDGLETIFTGLDSQDPQTVLAALRLLEEEGRPQVVPGLILYHPSAQVVAAALDLFARTGRSRSESLIERCFTHPASEVREAAVGAWVRLTGRPVPEALYADGAPTVRMAAQVASQTDSAVREAEPLLRAAAVRTAGRTARSPELIAELLQDRDGSVRRAAVEAARRAPHASLLAPLIPRLQEKQLRHVVIDALVRIEGAQAALQERLWAPDVPRAVKWEIPEALAQVASRPESASQALLEEFVAARDGMLRWRILLALQRLCDVFEDLELDASRLDRAIEAAVSRAYRYLDRRCCLNAGALRDPALATEGHRMIRDTLTAKQGSSVERLIRLLTLRHPQAGLSAVQAALRTDSKEDRAAAIELLEAVLKSPLRPAVVALVDERSDEDALREAGSFHQPLRLDYEALMQHMLDGGSGIMQDLVAFHVAELGWTQFLPELETLAQRRPESLDLARAVARLKERAVA